MRRAPFVLATVGFLSFLVSAAINSDFVWRLTGYGHRQLPPWEYLPAGLFLSSVLITCVRLSEVTRTSKTLEFGIISAGFLAALSIRAVADPHSYYVYPRLYIGLGLVALMLAPLFRSNTGTVFAITCGMLVLPHWFL